MRAQNHYPAALGPAVFALTALLPLLSGCSDSSSPRSVMQVVSVNSNQPLLSDVLVITPEGAAVVYEDVVRLELRCTPSDPVLNLTADGPYGSVLLDRYEVEFQGPERILKVSGPLGWIVPTGQTVSGDIVVVPAAYKLEPPLFSLREAGEIMTTARLTLYGHEDTSDYKITLTTALPVNFANWADD